LRVDYQLPERLPEPAREAELRYAVLWMSSTPRRFWIGPQGRLAPGSTHFEVRFEGLPELDFDALAPLEQLHLSSQTQFAVGGDQVITELVADVYRPRLVVYEDDNGNRVPDVSDDGERIVEPVIAIDSEWATGIAALRDPKAAVTALSLENAEAYYATNEAFSRFAYVTGTGRLELTSPTTIALAPGAGIGPVAPFCARSLISGFGATKLSLVVDARLDLVTICGVELADCESRRLTSSDSDAGLDGGDVESLEFDAGDFGAGTLGASTPGFEQCRYNGSLEAWTRWNYETECDQCQCLTRTVGRSLVVSRAAVPDGWPCGKRVAYCEPEALPLYSLATSCDLEPDASTRDAR
jgi:hypothetical protein